MSKPETKQTATRHQLDAELNDVKSQIRSYPQPIAGCDAQYQYLFDRRDYLVRQLQALQDKQDA